MMKMNMMTKRKYTDGLLSILANRLHGCPMPNGWEAEIDKEKLFSLSEYHAVGGLVADFLLSSDIPLLPSFKEKLQKCLMRDVFIEAGQSAVAEKLSEVLSGEKITHMFLKGYVMRRFYPAPSMRTSCDLDVLISPKDTESAKKALLKNGFTFLSEEEKDLHFSYPPKVHIELHRALAEEVYKDGKVYFDDALLRGLPFEGFTRLQSDEDFYVYMIFHLAKHFILGGSGVRSILDIWLYRKNVRMDEALLEASLEKIGLVSFEKSVVLLGKVWMREEKNIPLTESLTDFIMDAGTFGQQKTRVGLALGNQKKGRLRYLFSRAFPPRSSLQYRFPILKKQPFWLPFCWLVRFFDPFLPSKSKRLRDEIARSGMDREEKEKIIALYKELGLYEVL